MIALDHARRVRQGDWKRKRLVDPESIDVGVASSEIIADEGTRVA